MNDQDRLRAAFDLLECEAPTQIAEFDHLGSSRAVHRVDGRVSWTRPAAALAAVLVLVVAAAAVWQIARPARHDASQAVTTAFSYTAPTQQGQLIPVRQRGVAGDISVPSPFSGRPPLRLRALRGRAVVLTFCAAWCAPCDRELPELERAAQANAGRGVAVAGIVLGPLAAGESAPFLRGGKPKTMSFYWDRGQSTGAQLGGIPLATLPVNLLIDRRGRVAAVYSGVVTPAQLNSVLATLVAGH
jgi:thiol-disulfide isomerase/thioredoxin